jgi:hypothetical protein
MQVKLLVYYLTNKITIMKRLFNSLALPALMAVLALAGCEKDDALIYVEGGVSPVLAASTAAPVMDPKKENDLAIVFNWTNPNYKFTTGVSSQDVQYNLEIDTVGSNFTNPRKGVVVISKELSKSFTAYELNVVLSGLNQMGLPPDVKYNFEARIVSSIKNAIPLTSNVVKFTATPFSPPPVVELPTAGTLWATGNAFTSGWSNPLGSPFDVSQKFTPKTKTLYELIVDMPGGGNYKLIQQQGNWGTQYRMLEGGTWESGGLKKQDADPAFIGPPTAGKYKITVNFQSGKFTVVKQ